MLSAKTHSLVALIGLSTVCAWSGCSYDVDKLYSYSAEADGGVGDSGPPPLPADLIDLWEAPVVSEACAACARQKCAAENTACREDEECGELTRCIAASTDPANQYACRARHVDWLREDIALRDTGGPYQQCVFLNQCVAECDARNQIACKGNYSWPMTASRTVTLHLRFVEGLASNPTTGLRVRACQAEDALVCRGSSDWVTTDETGTVSLSVPATLGGFQGYLELEGGMIYPTLVRFGWPIANDLVTVVTVVNSASARTLIQLSAVPVEEDRGLLQLRAFGCGGVPLRGVTFVEDKADEKTAAWYTVGQEIFPNFDVTETGDRGAGGIVNAVAGRSLITATRDGEVIATLTAPVRAQYMTIVVLPPGDTSAF